MLLLLGIETKDLKLLDLVQSLGEYLTDEDKTIRAKAIKYLSAVLGFLDPKTLSRQQGFNHRILQIFPVLVIILTYGDSLRDCSFPLRSP
jgi:hypothetical protein